MASLSLLSPLRRTLRSFLELPDGRAGSFWRCREPDSLDTLQRLNLGATAPCSTLSLSEIARDLPPGKIPVCGRIALHRKFRNIRDI
ncbi:Hypothetical predicted protein [Podarcis lilfordi]|uniref:Uncharacterized protein n=1 Tax=Podarcis lilfordi TaxID=74358 RepID=A0AA35PDI1_9SAUR|nr:Hypothetical predicted protein [Podarcis lilfordi]